MELDEIELVDSEIDARAICPGPEVVKGVRLGNMRIGSPSHLRRDEKSLPIRSRLQEHPDRLLGSAVTIHIGRIEKGHPRVGSRGKDLLRSILVDVPPVAPQLPASQADHGNRSAQSHHAGRQHVPTVRRFLPACRVRFFAPPTKASTNFDRL